MIIRNQLVVVFIWTVLFVADAQGAVLESAPTNPMIALLKMIAALFVVLSVLWGASKLVRRFQSPLLQGKSGLRIVSSYQLGHREKLMVIQVGDEQLLLGVCATQIAKLHVLPKAIDLQTPIADDFKKTLKAAIGREVSS